MAVLRRTPAEIAALNVAIVVDVVAVDENKDSSWTSTPALFEQAIL